MAPKVFNLASIFILFVLNISSTFAVPKFGNFIGAQKGDQTPGIAKLKKYLSRFGYLEKNNQVNADDPNNDLFDETLESGLMLYQEFFNLPVTGVLDPQTIQKLNEPRCGVPDHPQNRNISLQYTFIPGNPKWSKTSLTYSFPPGTRKDVNHPIDVAIREWAKVSKFKFTYTNDYNKADVKISFQVRAHGDGADFDGSGGILAHASGPSYGILHFDGDEDWVDGAIPGNIDLQSVGMHEMGHILGLGHSTDPNALMYPSYSAGQRKGIGKDDIAGIQSLYK